MALIAKRSVVGCESEAVITGYRFNENIWRVPQKTLKSKKRKRMIRDPDVVSGLTEVKILRPAIT